ncbi:MAG: methyltransferase [Nanoarchaeota archaeon]|nr:methyltransferase [Nanoarchaeota archaeon]
MFEVYEPMEDSFLLAEHVKRYSKGFVLDVGTGPGIQAIAASEKAKLVIGIDISRDAIKLARENAFKQNVKNICFFESSLFDLFKKIQAKKQFKNNFLKEIKNKRIHSFLEKNVLFDLIIFNPPYLPQDKGISDKSIYGGIKGHETLERFFSEASEYLKENGKILIVFSSLTNKEKVDKILQDYYFEFKKLDEKKLFFETLFVYLIKKSSLLKTLEKKGLRNIKKFARGHRGLLYQANLKKKGVAIKTKNPKSKAKARIANEVKWIKILNKYKIGPKLLFSGREYFAYEFVEGDFILDFIEKNNKEDIIKIIKNVFNQLYIMDKLKVDKEEMHHPLKHIIIDKKPVLIDFERCKKTKKPKNITQFCQFLMSWSTGLLLKQKGIKLNKDKIIKLAKTYKKEQTKENLNKILNTLN